jgi:hypothetical protein
MVVLRSRDVVLWLVAAAGRAVEPQVPALARPRFLWHFPYRERNQGVLDGVPRGPVGPPGPRELAVLRPTARTPASGRGGGRGRTAPGGRQSPSFAEQCRSSHCHCHGGPAAHAV